MEKVLIFNGYYYPSKNCGGPITSIENIVNGCSKDFDFYIVCYNHDFNDNKPFDRDTNRWYPIGKAKVMYVEQNYLDFNKKNMKKLFLNLKPDLVWFSGVLTPNNKLVTAKLGKKMGIPILFSPRGEVSADRVKLKSYKKVPYLYFLRMFGLYNGCYFHGTSNDEIDGIVKYFNPPQDHIFRIPNISILPQESIARYLKSEGIIKLFFFSRIHEVKNLKFAIEAVINCKEKVVFDIYGPIESEGYWTECKKIIDTAPANIEISYKGVLKHDALSSVIQAHDAFLFPTINENYGHVIAEALANSRPVILSKGTTPWDDLDQLAGYVIALDNQRLFTEKIDEMALMTHNEYIKLIESTKHYFCNKIEEDGAVSGHIDMIHSIIQNYSRF